MRKTNPPLPKKLIGLDLKNRTVTHKEVQILPITIGITLIVVAIQMAYYAL